MTKKKIFHISVGMSSVGLPILITPILASCAHEDNKPNQNQEVVPSVDQNISGGTNKDPVVDKEPNEPSGPEQPVPQPEPLPQPEPEKDPNQPEPQPQPFPQAEPEKESVQPDHLQPLPTPPEPEKVPEITPPTNPDPIIPPVPKPIPAVHKTLWVDGVHIQPDAFVTPADATWSEMKEYPLKNHEHEGWYDINKRFANNDDFLCSAIVATNWLHWWLNNNKDYVDRYLQDPTKGFVTNGTKKVTLQEINQIDYDEDGYYDHSKIFDWFNDIFDAKAVWVDKLVDMFINGYNYSIKNEPNTPDNYHPSDTKGFFKDVFKAHVLTKRYGVGTLDSFSKNVKELLNENKALAIVHASSSQFSHIINVWGADFDQDGNVIALYITDGDDKANEMVVDGQKTQVGMKRYLVLADENGRNLKVSGAKPDENGALHGKALLNLLSLDRGVEQWEAYFKQPTK